VELADLALLKVVPRWALQETFARQQLSSGTRFLQTSVLRSC
jgi:hypothetical protein